MLTPFLPFTSQQLHEMLGYTGYIAGPLEFHDYTEAEGSTHRGLTGDYGSWVGHWQPSSLPIGQALQEPRPLFKKLDESVIAEELARMEAGANA
jgi:methionyl-tRNA synthetase